MKKHLLFCAAILTLVLAPTFLASYCAKFLFEDVIEEKGDAYLVRLALPYWWEEKRATEDFFNQILFAMVANKVRENNPGCLFFYEDGVGVLSCPISGYLFSDQSGHLARCPKQGLLHYLKSICFYLEQVTLTKQLHLCFGEVKAELEKELTPYLIDEQNAFAKEVASLFNRVTADAFADQIRQAVIELGAVFSHLYETTLEQIGQPSGCDTQFEYCLIDTVSFFETRYDGLGDEKKEKIVDLIHYMGYREKKWLLKRAKKLRALGKAVDDVHPFLFLTVIYREPDRDGCSSGLRDCLRAILEDGFKKFFFIYGEPFRDGLKHKLQKLAKQGEIEPYLPGFAAAISQDQQKIRSCIQQGAWEELLDLVAF